VEWAAAAGAVAGSVVEVSAAEAVDLAAEAAVRSAAVALAAAGSGFRIRKRVWDLRTVKVNLAKVA